MAMRKQAIRPNPNAPTSPYNAGVSMEQMVYVSGQGPLDPETGEIQPGDIEQQAELTMQNIQRVLKAAGCTMNDCVKLNVFLADMAHYDPFNRVYTRYFDNPLPARTLVQAGLLDILVEIDAIAIRGAGEES